MVGHRGAGVVRARDRGSPSQRLARLTVGVIVKRMPEDNAREEQLYGLTKWIITCQAAMEYTLRLG